MKALPLAAGLPRLTEIPREVALLHADGALPNHALMRLGKYFRDRGAKVRLVRPGDKRAALFGEAPTCYGSSIFSFSEKTRARMEAEWGPVVWGGTGVDVRSDLRDIDPLIDWDAVEPDYSLYPEFPHSIGFSQRGCRLKCAFCVVPRKEGDARPVSTIDRIWRGPGHPKNIVLLDNDFFGAKCPRCADPEKPARGQPRHGKCATCGADAPWVERIREIREGGYRVCFSQGINIRMIDEESAAALASIEYRDNDFRNRVLYTAWDNIGDEAIFKKGVATLEAAGIPAKHLRVYMLIGFAKGETFERIQYRFNEMVKLGCEPYPMVYSNESRPEGLPANRTLKHFQRWALTGMYRAFPFNEYDPHIRAVRSTEARHAAEGETLYG